MGVIPDGVGSSWDDAEAVDVNQPHGLAYRHGVHIAKGVRKRIAQQHTTFADSTVGGIHKPGKTSVLLLDTSTNLADYLTDASCAEFALACDTAAGKLFYMSDATDEWCVLPLNPSSFCMDADFTITGGLEIDGTVDFSAHANFDGSVDFSDAAFTGDVSVDGTFTVGGDAAFLADSSFDGTADFGDGVAFGAEVSIDGILKVDGTASEFGGTAGIGLFFDPTASPNGQSITFPNGLIMKHGTVAAANPAEISFAAAFPTAVVSANAVVYKAGTQDQGCSVNFTTTSLYIYNSDSGNCGNYAWQAWGY